MKVGLGILYFLCIFAFGIAQLSIGFLGIEHHLGSLWAWLSLGAAVLFKFTLPVTIGVFFGAMNILGWHWFFALIFALPGLLVMVPGVFATILSLVMDQRAGFGRI